MLLAIFSGIARSQPDRRDYGYVLACAANDAERCHGTPGMACLMSSLDGVAVKHGFCV